MRRIHFAPYLSIVGIILVWLIDSLNDSVPFSVSLVQSPDRMPLRLLLALIIFGIAFMTSVLWARNYRYHQRRRDQNLQETERMYMQLVENSPEMIGVHCQGKIVFINSAGVRMLGAGSVGELIGTPVMNLVHPDYREMVLARMQKMLREKIVADLAHEKLVRLDGEVLDVEIMGTPILYRGQPAVQILARDISDRLQHEKALHTTKRRTDVILQALPDNMITMSQNGVFIDYHSSDPSTFYTEPSQFLGRRYDEVLPEQVASLVTYHMKKLRDEKKMQVFEYQLAAKGELHDYEARLVSLQPDEVICLIRDISVLKSHERDMRRSLKEKDILIKEIHHRVKNNLQIITSLMNLQIQKVGDENQRMVFIESQNRVKAMAMIHDRLFMSDSLSEMVMADYIGSLIAALKRSYGFNESNLKLVTEIENNPISIDSAVSVGLLINELVSNSFKHALAGKDAAVLELSLKKKENQFVLTVADNGPGFPFDFDHQTVNSLGFQLINALCQQLKGSLRVWNDRGANVEVKFTA